MENLSEIGKESVELLIKNIKDRIRKYKEENIDMNSRANDRTKILNAAHVNGEIHALLEILEDLDVTEWLNEYKKIDDFLKENLDKTMEIHQL
jgi:hypothetical protein